MSNPEPLVTFENVTDAKGHIGKPIGPTDWVEITQDMINMFADATGDHQWIHVDVERAKTEMPGGKTIAHGYLTLSLLPSLSFSMVAFTNSSRGINYGSNKVRFTNMVPVGSRVRLTQTYKSVEDVKGNGVQIISEAVVEIEGQERPALVAETIALVYA